MPGWRPWAAAGFRPSGLTTMTISGNSIKLHDGMMTEIACEDMVTEEALRKILPRITTVDVENDSIVKLNSNRPAGYIVLSKAKIEIK